MQTVEAQEKATPAGPVVPRGLARLPGGKWTKWIVLGFWLVVFLGVGPLAGQMESVQNDDPISFLPDSAESTRANTLEEKFQDDVIPAMVVYERDGGITAADEARAKADAAEFGALDRRAGDIVGPIPSDDGEALQILVPLEYRQDLNKDVNEIREIVDGAPSGLEVNVTGPAAGLTDVAESFGEIDTTLLFTALLVVVVLLLIIYRSPFLWLVPIVAVLVGLSLAQAVVYLLGEYADLPVNGMSSGILLVLVFGVGTDYALLLVARYREELRRHENKHEAMAFALRGAGPAILASAATVILALLFLLLAEMNSNSGLGPVAAVGVGCAFLTLTTLLPALMTILPRGVFWPAVPRYNPAYEDRDVAAEHGAWSRIARLVSAHPRVVWLTAVVLLGAMTFGLASLKAEGMKDADLFLTKPESVVGGEALARHYPAGTADPTVVLGNSSAAEGLGTAISGTPGVAKVGEPAVKDNLVRYEVTLEDSPYSQGAFDTVDRLRDRVHEVSGADAKVGGFSAIRLDTLRASERDRNLLIPIVLLVVLLVLVALLRSIVAPLLLIATVVLSFAAALGISGLVFEHLFGFAGADANLPLLAFVFLVALGVDYNIFLMTRVREEALGVGVHAGTVRGLVLTGGVITSAGVVLAATFAAATTLPLVTMIELGFVVALGILLDTFIVRSLLVPALSLDVGRRIWWPSKLAKEAAG